MVLQLRIKTRSEYVGGRCSSTEIPDRGASIRSSPGPNAEIETSKPDRWRAGPGSALGRFKPAGRDPANGGIGASRPLPSVPAKVASSSRQPPLSSDLRNWSSYRGAAICVCPYVRAN